MKKYITWKSKKINDNYFTHPNTSNRASNESNWDIIFTETSYKSIDWRYMSFVEHDGALPQARLDSLMIMDADFEFTSVTEESMNADLLEAYWTTEWPWLVQPMVSVSNFVFTDLRPNEI